VPQEDDLREVVDGYTRTSSQTVEAARIALSAPLRPFWDFYTLHPLRALVDLMAGLLRGFEQVMARGADAYVSEAISVLTGSKFSAVGIRKTKLGREGIGDDDVLMRVAAAYRYQQAQIDKAIAAGSGDFLTLQQPKEAAQDRLDKIVTTNLQMAERSQFRTTMAGSDKITGYRRIIHPELDREGTCGLCVASSTRIYHKAELLPIHAGCNCTVLPITSKRDPHSLNEIDFARLYNDAGGTSAADLRATQYKIDQHGEIGPVLRPHDEPIRPKAGAPRAPAPRSTGALVRKLTKRRDDMAAALTQMEAEGRYTTADLQPGRDRVEQLSAEIERMKEAA
jgi:hypothetical protein